MKTSPFLSVILVASLTIGVFLTGVPFCREELRVANQSLLAPRTSFRNGSVAFGTICDEPQHFPKIVIHT